MADDDEDLWPPFYLSHRSGRSPAARREEQFREKISQMREGGRKPPGRDRSLSRGEIVRTAIAVADAEGPDAISMRRIARELHAGAMSLYWHVSSKEELLDLMLDAVQGEMTVQAASEDIRADLRAMALSQRATLRRHRWIMPFMGGRPPAGPKSLRNTERLLALFTPRQVDSGTAMNMLMSVLTYVMGAVLREQQEDRSHQDEERVQERLGLSQAELHDVYGEFIEHVTQTGRYPNLTEMIKQGIDPDALETQDERFEFGLDCLLDGIMTRLGPDQATATPQ